MSAISSSNDVIICATECGTNDKISANKKECTSCEQKNDDGVSCELLNDMSINGDKSADIISTCANCGKEGADVTNTCNKCKTVKYCNAACKKKHRHKHKKECERIVSELHDEALFKQPPPPFDDCPICFLRMPVMISRSTYMACCGKVICNGCIIAVKMKTEKHSLCAFCRTPDPTSSKEEKERYEKRAEAGDPIAIYNVGSNYFIRDGWYEQNHEKALELWQKAGELGYAPAYQNIGSSYMFARGVEVDEKKAMHYFRLAAMKGVPEARNNLGADEEDAGDIERAIKHYTIAARDGSKRSVKNIQDLYLKGNATKDDYAKALYAYQEYLNEIKSAQRDEAAASLDQYRYY